MAGPSFAEKEKAILERGDLQKLFDALQSKGWRVMGPALGESAIILRELKSASELPEGYSDQQDGGVYRLVKNQGKALFNYVLGSHCWKKFLHAAILRLVHAKRGPKGFEVEGDKQEPVKTALFGVRPCELSAIAIQDKVLTAGEYVDSSYQARREAIFVVAVNCARPGGTCFCASMKTGPKAHSGFDIALTEVIEGTRHYFVAEAGTSRGGEVLGRAGAGAAGEAELAAAGKVETEAAGRMGRKMDTSGMKDILYRNYENPRWEETALRCLSCGNCTLVCPTCFCTNVEDKTDLSGDNAERWRKWDTCFTVDFSYIHGGSIRPSVKARYRQWMVHKLAAWQDQFGTPGCVGCGRCITWCPVGIDITEEMAALRKSDPGGEGVKS